MIERTHYRLEEFRKMLGIGRTTLWRLVRAGKVVVDRSLGIPLIPATCLPTCHPARVSEERQETQRHLTKAEQQVFQRALRRSATPRNT